MPITASINVTPDGFCNHDDVVADDDFLHFEAGLIEASDRVVIGRRTYDLFVAHWPDAARDDQLSEAERRLACAIDETPRLVISHSLDGSDWNGTTILKDFDRTVASELARQEDLIVLGSPAIFTQLSQWDCIDRYHFVVEPIVSGHGHRLFETENLGRRQDLWLEDCTAFSSGAVSLLYSKGRHGDA